MCIRLVSRSYSRCTLQILCPDLWFFRFGAPRRPDSCTDQNFLANRSNLVVDLTKHKPLVVWRQCRWVERHPGGRGRTWGRGICSSRRRWRPRTRRPTPAPRSSGSCTSTGFSSSVTLWYGSGSGSATPYLWLTDLDTDQEPAIFVSDLQSGNVKFYFCLLLFGGTFASFFKDKKSQNSRNEGFYSYFCLIIEGSGSGSTPRINGSGSGSRRSKNIRIRICNTIL